MKSLAIIFVNAVTYFALCVSAFLLTSLFTGSDPTEKEYLSVSPLTLAATVSLPVAVLHGLVIGGAITFWKDQLSKKLLEGAAILALVANLLTAFWWMFLFLQLGEQPDPSASARGVVAAAVMTAVSFLANLITLQFVRHTQIGGAHHRDSADTLKNL
jgi:hypothetical protein